MTQIKSNLRTDHLTKLKQLSKKKRAKINQHLQERLYQHPEWKKAQTIGITINLPHEWETWAIIETAWQVNKTIAVPKCDPTLKQMDFYHIKSKSDLAVQYYNLMEPIEGKANRIEKNQLDLLIVPGIVFDHDYYRIGHGGGYYDRFLADFKAYTLSLAWKGQVIEKIDTESFDLPIKDMIIADV